MTPGDERAGPDLIRAPRELRDYSQDCWPQALAWSEEVRAAHAPEAAGMPRTEEETAALLIEARREGLFVVPRGAGSGVVGAAIPVRESSMVLDTTALDKKFDLHPDPESPRVSVGAGWFGHELEARLNREGYSLRHFPASMDISTVGGWIAMDSFGQLSTRYGPFGTQVGRVRVVLPDGSIVSEDPAIHLGAEGTLGVVTEADILIRTMPRQRRFFTRGFSEAAEALAFCRQMMRSEIKPSVLRLYSPVDAFLTGLRRKGRRAAGSRSLLERFEPFLLKRHGWLEPLLPLAGRTWVVVLIYEEEKDFALPGTLPDRGSDLGAGPAQRWWERRYHWNRSRLENVIRAGCFADTLDLWAPWDVLPRLETEVLRALKVHAMAFSHFSHFDAEGACLYVTFAGSGSPGTHARAWEDALEACAAAGGRVNHHHGFGIAKKGWVDRGVDSSRLRNIRRRKAEVDPKGLFNPGKLMRDQCR